LPPFFTLLPKCADHHGQSLELFNIKVLAQIIEVSLALHGATVFIAVTSESIKSGR
jgi:hypothetical protein